jgi:CAAX protease family protein
MNVVLAHLLAAYAVLAAPWLGYVTYNKARARIAAGVPNARVSLYREIVVEQIVTTGVVLALWGGGVSGASLGLIAPSSWAWTLAASVVMVAALAWSSWRLRPRAEKIREKVKDGIGTLVPDSHQERFWFGAVSVGAGVSEELVFRGFLLYYLMLYLPQSNTPERVLLASLVFGFAHIYQGWKGAVAAGILGMVLAGFYLMTGSLLLPLVIHAAVDARVLLIFPPHPLPAMEAEGHA